MKSIYFVNARDDRFKYDAKHAQNASLDKLQLIMECKLLVNPKFDFISTYIIMAIKSNSNRVLDYAVLLTYKIDGWGKFASLASPEEIKETPEVRRLIELSVGFVRGALYTKEKGTPVENYNLPIIDIDGLVKRTVVIHPDK